MDRQSFLKRKDVIGGDQPKKKKNEEKRKKKKREKVELVERKEIRKLVLR